MPTNGCLKLISRRRSMQHKDRLAVRELAVFLAALGAASIVAASVVFFLGAHGVLEVGQL
jgi:hypothetical protein